MGIRELLIEKTISGRRTVPKKGSKGPSKTYEYKLNADIKPPNPIPKIKKEILSTSPIYSGERNS
jgi:hypothetical protein